MSFQFEAFASEKVHINVICIFMVSESTFAQFNITPNTATTRQAVLQCPSFYVRTRPDSYALTSSQCLQCASACPGGSTLCSPRRMFRLQNRAEPPCLTRPTSL